MDNLKLFCVEFLIEQLDTTNAFGVRHLGQHYCASRLVCRSNKFIASNFGEFTYTEHEFLSLDKEEVVALLSRSDLEVKLGECNFIANTFWMKKSSR